MGKGRISHRSKLCWRINSVYHINYTVAANKTGIDIFSADAHFYLRVVQYLVEIRGDGLGEHISHVDVDELCHGSLGDAVDFTVFRLQVLTFVLPPSFQSLVGRNEHSASIIVHVGIA